MEIILWIEQHGIKIFVVFFILLVLLKVLRGGKKIEENNPSQETINSIESVSFTEDKKKEVKKLSLKASLALYLILAITLYFNEPDWSLSVFLPIFPAIGFFLLCDLIYYKSKGIKVFGLVMNRKIYSTNSGENSSRTYAHKILFKINNETYSEWENYGQSRILTKGTKIIAYVNPYDFSKFRIIGKFNYFLPTIFLVIGFGTYFMHLFKELNSFF